MISIYQFSATARSLDGVKGSRAYKLRAALDKGKRLSREDKNWLTAAVNNNAYFKKAVPVLGWCIDFSDVLRPYIVSQYGMYRKIWACDKTAIRKMTSGKIDEIF